MKTPRYRREQCLSRIPANSCRLPWTPEEECDIAESLLKVAKQEAAERKRVGINQYSEPPVNLTEGSGEAIEVVAAALGKSKNTLKKQMEVVATARDESQPKHVREVARGVVTATISRSSQAAVSGTGRLCCGGC